MAKKRPAAVGAAPVVNLTLAALAKEIADKNLGWEPGRTSLTDKSVSQSQGSFGLAVDPDVLSATADKVRGDERYWGLMGTFSPPPSINWKQKDGGDYVKTARHQEDCQSCVAFAVVGAIEANTRIANRNPNHFIELSETDLFACGCGPCCGRGWYPIQALEHCQLQGVAPRATVPYKPFNVSCPGTIAGRVRIASYSQLTTRTSIKQALCEQGPCVYGMVVYQDFYHYYRQGVYRYAAGGSLGNHAILIVGYDDAQSCWICKNSWGIGWGEDGFFRIHYDDRSFIGAGYAFPAFSVRVAAPVVETTCQQYVPHLKEVIQAAWANPDLKAYLRYWVCGLPPQPPAQAQFNPLTNEVRGILRTCPNYLDWFCQQLLSR